MTEKTGLIFKQTCPVVQDNMFKQDMSNRPKRHVQSPEKTGLIFKQTCLVNQTNMFKHLFVFVFYARFSFDFSVEQKNIILRKNIITLLVSFFCYTSGLV